MMGVNQAEILSRDVTQFTQAGTFTSHQPSLKFKFVWNFQVKISNENSQKEKLKWLGNEVN